eukprot:CAMPEP_0198726570 /NCGR_PEP_ID=MMETSP1475-20131203/3584_1 /TAXON_ID= ORGANISM="Unidentified sp., Strain CCMP1999" /NCGR_SAMPLE_ID=MMETSP1475 /ASSEMBLY_ACC=CAM_ASM_001111 /LENGTH=476 /DNA_ID=CAMNT_0044488505 /DNA_START=90 /DNA_END=1520 /DNA_ORIENTATION=+
MSVEECAKEGTKKDTEVDDTLRRDPYEVLGIEAREMATEREVRNAYLRLARKLHPDVGLSGDVVIEGDEEFDRISKAYELLSDRDRRKIYDDLGFDGLDALDTVRARAKNQNMYAGVDPLELEQMMEMDGSNIAYLEMANDIGDTYDPEAIDHEDSCPRSIEEGIWNVKNHPDIGYRYYAAWWLARFGVSEAEKTLVEMLQGTELKQPGFEKLYRRAVIALGKVAKVKPVAASTLLAIGSVMNDPDYNLRYNAAEAISKIADRNDGAEGFPQYVVDQVEEKIRSGAETSRSRRLDKISQKSLFDFEALDPAVAEKLKAIMNKRQEQIETSDRYNQTAGFDYEDLSEPWEKLIKAAADLRLYHLVDCMEEFVVHPIPLVRHAAKKFIYLVRKDPSIAEELCSRLEFGSESALTQNVVCLDIGDLGYVPGAMRMVRCESAASSIKLLGLKKMLERHDCDTANSKLNDLFVAMDDLIVG